MANCHPRCPLGGRFMRLPAANREAGCRLVIQMGLGRVKTRRRASAVEQTCVQIAVRCARIRKQVRFQWTCKNHSCSFSISAFLHSLGSRDRAVQGPALPTAQSRSLLKSSGLGQRRRGIFAVPSRSRHRVGHGIAGRNLANWLVLSPPFIGKHKGQRAAKIFNQAFRLLTCRQGRDLLWLKVVFSPLDNWGDD